MALRKIGMVAVWLALAGGATRAQEQAVMKAGNFYGGVMAGVVLPEDIKFSASAAQGGGDRQCRRQVRVRSRRS
jgi:hypothetical protein